MFSSQSSRGASRRSSTFTENFRTFTTSLGSPPIHSRLERRRWLGVRDPTPDICTALSSNGWIATASDNKVRLYNYKDVDTTREIKCSFSIDVTPESDRIRAIALSDDLLAIVTHSRLLVYEYRTTGAISDNLVDSREIDQRQTWTPKSIAIRQRGAVGERLVASAFIVVGGERKTGAKLFSYAYEGNCWCAHSDRVLLSCPSNTGSIKIVSFSPNESKALEPFLVCGVSNSDVIYCWRVDPTERLIRTVDPSLTLNCTSGRLGTFQRGEITSVAIFSSPSKRPYLFCSVNQRHGSHTIRSFLAPLEQAYAGQSSHSTQWRELPEETVGRNMLCGTVTSNGLFIVVVEEGIMRLLRLQGACEGGLTCWSNPINWVSSLKPAATDVLAVSVSAKEEFGRLHVTAVDGRGHVLFARVSVPKMPPPDEVIIERVPRAEVPSEHLILEIAASSEGSRRSNSIATQEQDQDRIDIVPG
ncbi:hypothetical protein K491DRAFT_757004 [Lophiostoma macrostomum CBS 122681]|uniref:WD40 repeat-like protein n=1 Tax=Lophiostoma macrostomum CBS 122681 TaxID=1314788 RepID=A0A6A6TD87_9PLEO|nr:hypothetical protein K491DRAFT_757004 [Lophiostoma macrostomum CBS 122681]